MAMVVVAVIYVKTRKTTNNPPQNTRHPLEEKFPEHFKKTNPNPSDIKQVLTQKIRNNEVEFEIASSRGKAAIEIDGIKFKHIRSKQTPPPTDQEILKDFDLPEIPDNTEIPTPPAPTTPDNEKTTNEVKKDRAQ